MVRVISGGHYPVCPKRSSAVAGLVAAGEDGSVVM